MLNRLLPRGYVAEIGERIYVVQPDRSIYPDVAIFEHPISTASIIAGSSSAAAVADPPIVLHVEPLEIREVFVEIVPVGDETRVVTVIEVLRYINKARGSDGQGRDLAKQKELLASSINFIEIDLLRSGEHTVGFPQENLLRIKRWDYLVSLNRNGRRGHPETWPRTVRERLPRIRVPLENELPDITLDLQEVFDKNYDDGAYARRVDYSRDLAIPLAREDGEWADGLLRAANLRP